MVAQVDGGSGCLVVVHEGSAGLRQWVVLLQMLRVNPGSLMEGELQRKRFEDQLPGVMGSLLSFWFWFYLTFPPPLV